MEGTIASKPLAGVCDRCGKFGDRCACMGTSRPPDPLEIWAPPVVIPKVLTPKVVIIRLDLERVAEEQRKRERAMWAASILATHRADPAPARARSGEERKARLAAVLRTIATDKATRTMAERRTAFEAGGPLISNDKFEFTRPRPLALAARGLVKTPIPRIDPSDY